MTTGFGRSLLAALTTGVVFYTVYLFWMKEYKHPLALSGGILGVMVFWTAAAIISYFLYHKLPTKGRPYRGLPILGLVCGWFIIDYVKTIGFLGFPWGILGYSQYQNLVLIQSASLFGIWGINFLMLLCNASLAGLILDFLLLRKTETRIAGVPLMRRLIYGAVVLILLVLSFAWGVLKRIEEKNRVFPQKRIAMVQANFDPWSPRLRENITTEIDLTLKALINEPDLIVWSESSVPFPYEIYLGKENPHGLRVHQFARVLDRPFVFGTLEYELTDTWRYYNVAVYYNEGTLQESYRKIHLVPFGEWFPYKRLFPFVVNILDAAGAGDFTPGERYSIFRDGELRFNVLICFEDVFGNLARQFVKRGSQLIINVTNDAWTGSEKAEIQHYSISVFRAIENRRSLVRAANGGVTVCVNPYGRPTARLDLFTSELLVCDVDIVDSSELTFYTKNGELIPLILLPLTLLAGLILLGRLFLPSK
jgi:apolipoprotein N-acyltransferase